MIQRALSFIFLFLINAAAHASDADEIMERFQLIPEPPCQKPSIRAPREIDTPFFSERHYLTIDGGKECQIFDVWVAPLTKLENENRRYMEAVLYRRRGNAWVKEYGLQYIPKFRLMDKKTGKVYLYIHLDETPFSTDQVVYFNGVWQGDKKSKTFYGNIRRLGNCIDRDQGECFEEAEKVTRAVEFFKEK